MARTGTRPKVPNVIVEYENLDAPPCYVENVQGMLTPKGSVQMYFFSDFFVPPPTLKAKTTVRASGDMDMKIDDPYGMQSGTIHVRRRLEGNMIFSEAALRDLYSWVGNMLSSMDEANQKRAG